MSTLLFLILIATLAAAVSSIPIGEIQQKVRKLGSLISAFFVAAHPDDGNTRLIAYFANEALAETTYLSLLLRDGGQNLLG